MGKEVDMLFPVKIGAKYGFINNRGELIIQPKYYSAQEFQIGLAIVWLSKYKFGAIDKFGNLQFEYDAYRLTTRLGDFNDNLCLVNEIARTYEDEEKYYFLNREGKKAISADYESIGDFSEGFAPFCISNYSFEKKWGFINTNGFVVIQPEYDSVGFFSEGLACIEINDKYGFIYKDGRIVIETLYEDVQSFSEGLAAVKKDGKWGYISRGGKLVIEYTFDNAEYFSEGIAAVRIGMKWFYINSKGKIIIEPQFQDDLIDKNSWKRIFSCGLAAFIKDTKWGFIDKTGNIVIPPKYSKVSPFKNGVASVEVESGEIRKTGYIDIMGKEVWSKSESIYDYYGY